MKKRRGNGSPTSSVVGVQPMIELSVEKKKTMLASVGLSIQPMYDQLSDWSRGYKVFSHALPIVSAYYRTMEELGRLSKKYGKEEYEEIRDRMLEARHEAMAVRIAKMYKDLGGVYLKAAQYAVSQGALLPAAWERELKFAFNAAKARPWLPEMRETVLTEVLKFDEAFEYIVPQPIAAASVAQVHRGQLKRSFYQKSILTAKKCGLEVAIKIIYPDARRNMAADLRSQRELYLKVDSILKVGASESIKTILDEFDHNFPRELDLRVEAQNMRTAAAIFKKRGFAAQVLVPALVPELSSRSVLVTQFIHGTTLANLNPNLMTHEKKNEAMRAILTVIDAIGASLFLDGFLHADSHAGNLILYTGDYSSLSSRQQQQDDDDLTTLKPALIDWGQCARLETNDLRLLARLVLLLQTQSPTFLTMALTDTADISFLQTDDDFRFSASNHIPLDTETKAALLYQFFDSTVPPFLEAEQKKLAYLLQHDLANCPVFLKIPRAVVFFGRAVAALAKSLALIDPDHNISITQCWAKYARAALQKQELAHFTQVPQSLPHSPSYINRGRKSQRHQTNTAMDTFFLTLPVDQRWLSLLEMSLSFCVFFAITPLRYFHRVKHYLLDEPDLPALSKKPTASLGYNDQGVPSTTSSSERKVKLEEEERILLPYQRNGQILASFAVWQPRLLTILLTLAPRSDFVHYFLLPRIADALLLILNIVFAFRNVTITILDSFTA